jgi:DNA-binding NarL/FixJ family response regulator
MSEAQGHQHLRVAIADRRILYAEALAANIEAETRFRVSAIVAGDNALSELLRDPPAAVVIRVCPDAHSTASLASSLRVALPDLGVVLVAERLAPELVRWVLDQGPSGLVLTDAHAGELLRCLEDVALGQTVLPRGWRDDGAGGRGDGVLGDLSSRQLEVLGLLADGLAYEEIAARLFISVNTVKFHVHTIFLRLGVHNRMAAARALSQSPPS